MNKTDYLMEHGDEAARLDQKTIGEAVVRQARLAGLSADARIADLGCGSGKTTSILNKYSGGGSQAIGVDIATNRIDYAKKAYETATCRFEVADARESLEHFGEFDFVWVRFLLEYYRVDAERIIANASAIVKPGGRLCLIDLDNNCLNHYEISERLDRTLVSLMKALELRGNFDPYAGRKLYARMYDLGYRNIEVNVEGHHVIYGALQTHDEFNWMQKAAVAPKKIGFEFTEYEGGYEEFRDEFRTFFDDPRRFTYSPLVVCSGIKPARA